MNRNIRLTSLIATALTLVIADTSFAQDWPQWRGPNRDAKITGFVAPQTWPKSLSAKWKITVGAGDATPALVGDKLYVFARVGGDEITLCLNAADGSKVWENKTPAPAVTGPASGHPGPRSSPAVADGKVVTLGVGGTLSCLDAADGHVLWRKDDFTKSIPQFFTASSPIIADGLCIVQLGGRSNGLIAAFDLTTGAEKWKWTGDSTTYSSPVLATIQGVKQIVAMTDKNLVGLSAADGKLLWQSPIVAQGRAYNAPTPIIDGQTIYCTGSGKGTKAVKIEKQGDKFTATEAWTNAQLGTNFNTPVLKDGFLYGISDRGNLFCLNAQDGKTAWTDTARLNNFASIVDAGSVILALPSTSELIAFKPDGKQYEQLARIKIADGQTFSYPIVSGNKLFVKDQQSLAMLPIE
jgi:outer membrane protein assembly factor BamB